MTAFSTTAAIGFLPLNMFVYTRSWVGAITAIPYQNIVITIVATWLAVAMGVLVGWKAPRAAVYVARVSRGLVSGLAIAKVGIIYHCNTCPLESWTT